MIVMIIAAARSIAVAVPPDNEGLVVAPLYSAEESIPSSGYDTAPFENDMQTSTDSASGYTDEDLARQCLEEAEQRYRAATRYLRELYLMFDDWQLALAAYNRGEYGLARDLERSGAACLASVSGRGILPRETESFVPRFIACALIGKYPERYGGFRVCYEKPPRYETVVLGRSIDLKVAARCAGCTIAELRALNPAIKAWCTPYRYAQFSLHLPAGTGKRFLKAIAAIKDANPDRGYIKYHAARGERLDAVARQFATTVQELRLVNRIMKDIAVTPRDMILMVRPGIAYLNRNDQS